MSDGLVIVSLLSGTATGKIWLELFEDIIFFIILNLIFRTLMFSRNSHSYKKRKDSLEGSLD